MAGVSGLHQQVPSFGFSFESGSPRLPSQGLEREHSRRTCPNVQVLIKLRLASHLLMSYWSKQVTWLSLEGEREGDIPRHGYWEVRVLGSLMDNLPS